MADLEIGPGQGSTDRFCRPELSPSCGLTLPLGGTCATRAGPLPWRRGLGRKMDAVGLGAQL